MFRNIKVSDYDNQLHFGSINLDRHTYTVIAQIIVFLFSFYVYQNIFLKGSEYTTKRKEFSVAIDNYTDEFMMNNIIKLDNLNQKIKNIELIASLQSESNTNNKALITIAKSISYLRHNYTIDESNVSENTETLKFSDAGQNSNILNLFNNINVTNFDQIHFHVSFSGKLQKIKSATFYYAYEEYNNITGIDYSTFILPIILLFLFYQFIHRYQQDINIRQTVHCTVFSFICILSSFPIENFVSNEIYQNYSVIFSLLTYSYARDFIISILFSFFELQNMILVCIPEIYHALSIVNYISLIKMYYLPNSSEFYHIFAGITLMVELFLFGILVSACIIIYRGRFFNRVVFLISIEIINFIYGLVFILSADRLEIMTKHIFDRSIVSTYSVVSILILHCFLPSDITEYNQLSRSLERQGRVSLMDDNELQIVQIE